MISHGQLPPPHSPLAACSCSPRRPSVAAARPCSKKPHRRRACRCCERRRGATPSTKKLQPASSMLERKRRPAAHRPCVLIRRVHFLCVLGCIQPTEKLLPVLAEAATTTAYEMATCWNRGSGMLEPLEFFAVTDGNYCWKRWCFRWHRREFLLQPASNFAGMDVCFCWNQQWWLRDVGVMVLLGQAAAVFAGSMFCFCWNYNRGGVVMLGMTHGEYHRRQTFL